MFRSLQWLVVLTLFFGRSVPVSAGDPPSPLWVMKPVIQPPVPTGFSRSANPIDAFVAAEYKSRGLTPVGPADKRTLLRRVYLDLIGLPPSPTEQEAFLKDESPDAYEKVVDRLLASEQHGVRYARHWLDVLRYADADERMIAAPGIYLWRDWVIRSLNSDLPFDQFVRTQLTGYRTTARTQMSATGYRSRVEPRPDDQFALGFLSRGAVVRDNKNSGELAIFAVETASAAFMGLTVGCAKCHDHMYDPISQRDFYAMKALFDPLVVRKMLLGTPAEVVAAGKAMDETARQRAAIEGPLEALTAPYRKKLYDDRVAMLPDDVQTIIHKPEKTRTVAEQKIADDYYPVLRIDGDKISESMTAADRRKYQDFQRQLSAANGRIPGIHAFWTVEVDPQKATETSYILTSGDPDRPEKNHEVTPGWPFAPETIDFREGRIEAFTDWLCTPENPLFARVAVNRLWQWHFGEGLQKTSSDFGLLGGSPSNPKLLDWLAAEFASRKFSMKAMHRLMVTSETYKLASDADAAVTRANGKADSENAYLWRFRLQRLEAEPVWDSIFTVAGTLDPAVGGSSFDVATPAGRRGGRGGNTSADAKTTTRRAAYMVRGYSTSRDVTPVFLQAFDVDDGRAPCPLRTQSVTSPQALFLMNSNEIERASAKVGERLKKESGGDLTKAVDLAFQIGIARPPSPSEKARALEYLDNDPDRLKGLAWLIFNLDEFLYVR